MSLVKGTASKTGTSASVSIAQADFSTPPASGDVVVFFFTASFNSKGGVVMSPSGFTPIDVRSDVNTGSELDACYKVAGSSEGTYTASETSATGFPMSAFAVVLDGTQLHATAPDVHSTTLSQASGSTSMAATGITTNSSFLDILIAGWCSESTGTDPITLPAAETTVGAQQGGDNLHAKVGYEILSTTGATGTRTATRTTTNGGWMAVVVAFTTSSASAAGATSTPTVVRRSTPRPKMPLPRARSGAILEQTSPVATKPPRRFAVLATRRSHAVIPPLPQAPPSNPAIVLNRTQQRRALRVWLSTRGRTAIPPLLHPTLPVPNRWRPTATGVAAARIRRNGPVLRQDPAPAPGRRPRPLLVLRWPGHVIRPPWSSAPPPNPPSILDHRRSRVTWAGVANRARRPEIPQVLQPSPRVLQGRRGAPDPRGHLAKSPCSPVPQPLTPPATPPIVLRILDIRRVVGWITRGHLDRFPWSPAPPPSPIPAVPTVYLSVRSRATSVAASEPGRR